MDPSFQELHVEICGEDSSAQSVHVYKKWMPALDSSLCPPDIQSRYTLFAYSQITPFIVMCWLEFVGEVFRCTRYAYNITECETNWHSLFSCVFFQHVDFYVKILMKSCGISRRKTSIQLLQLPASSCQNQPRKRSRNIKVCLHLTKRTAFFFLLEFSGVFLQKVSVYWVELATVELGAIWGGCQLKCVTGTVYPVWC